jgi:hypothetical protein
MGRTRADAPGEGIKQAQTIGRQGLAVTLPPYTRLPPQPPWVTSTTPSIFCSRYVSWGARKAAEEKKLTGDPQKIVLIGDSGVGKSYVGHFPRSLSTRSPEDNGRSPLYLETVCQVVSIQYKATILTRITSARAFHEGRIQPELQVDYWRRVRNQGYHRGRQAGEGSDLGYWCAQFGSHSTDSLTNALYESWSGTIPGNYCRVSSDAFISYGGVLTTVYY